MNQSAIENKVLPNWFKQDLPGQATSDMLQLLRQLGLNTVCQQAKCPNLTYCFRRKEATFIILGDTCTRSCKFCNIKKSLNAELAFDADEPNRISRAVKALGLNYVVITSVTRDDLPDGGAEIFAEAIRSIKKVNSNIKVEVLIPDFQGSIPSLEAILNAGPSVVGHNIETVSRLYGNLRPQADYGVSLGVLRALGGSPAVITKSSIMLGLGEIFSEVIETMGDLKRNGCDILVLGQYLAPTINHYPVKEFIDIKQFAEYKKIALALGFKSVLSEPLARTSYKAAEVFHGVGKYTLTGTSKALSQTTENRLKVIAKRFS